ncbi:MAG: tetratricopeptide repeat protein [Lachnospiraceae bacterium]|nr:tetratricopeptide repeat protein [Lachnospiraceae bacterium]
MRHRCGKTMIAIALAASVFLGGCHGVDRKEQAHLRDAGTAAMAAGNFEEAEKDFKDAIALSGGHVSDAEIDLTYYLGACYFLQNRYEDAIKVYGNLLTYNEKDAQALFLRGSVYLKIEDAKKALADYRKATELAPKDYELALAIYENLKANGKKGRANDFLNAALEIEGEEAENFYYRGRIYQFLGREDMAETAFRRAMDGGCSDASVYLAKAYMEKGQKKKARKVAAFYVNKDDPAIEESVLAGELLLVTEQYEKANEVYVAALAKEEEEKEKKKNGTYSEYHKELLKGQIAALEYDGEFEEALSLAEAYLAMYPSDQNMVREVSFLEER